MMLYATRTTRAALSTLALLLALTGCNPDEPDEPTDTGEPTADTAIDADDTTAEDSGEAPDTEDTGPVEDTGTDTTEDGGPTDASDTASGDTRGTDTTADTSDTASGDTTRPDTTADTSDTVGDTTPPPDTVGDTMTADTAPDTTVPTDTGPDADTGGSNLTIGWCNIQYPKSITVTAGNATPTVYGRAYVAGCTTDTMECSALEAEVGWGSSGVDPSQNPGMYNWAQASYNSGHPSGSTSGSQRNNDEHQATFTPQTTGTFDFVYRFSVDGGQSWTYCDTDGSPYEPSKLGDLTVN
jgi:hypothetical protein